VVGDPPSLHDPMGVAPLGPDQLTMPTADRVGRDEGRQTFSDWSQALENGEHPSLLGSEPWPGHLTVKHVELLTQDQELEVLGPGRATPEQEQAKDLSKTDSGETEGHRPLSRCDEGDAGEEEVPGRAPTLWWHPPGRRQSLADGTVMCVLVSGRPALTGIDMGATVHSVLGAPFGLCIVDATSVAGAI